MVKKSRSIAFQAIRGRLPVLQYLPPAELLIDPVYQRQIDGQASQALIRKIAENWDWSLCQPLVVSDRDGAGQLFVIDGQHRLAAALLRGDIGQLPCVVVNYPDAASEAGGFVALNQLRRPLNGIEVFRAAIASGDAEAMAIRDAVEAAGLMIAAHTNNKCYKPGEIGNVGGLRKAWRTHGPGVTGKALCVMADAFSGERLGYAGSIFPGIAAVISARPKFATQLVLPLQEKGQSALYSAIMKARSVDPNLNFDRASAQVIDQLLREALGEPDPKAATPKPQPDVDLSKFHHNYAWCNQCDWRVSVGHARACANQFCKLKAQNAAPVKAFA
jgi:hypothetical protein